MSLADEFEGIKQAALIRTPGADPSLIDLEARWVISEFLAETRVYNRVFSMALLSGLDAYSLTLGTPTPLAANEAGVLVLNARVDGVPVQIGHNPLGAGEFGTPKIVGMPNDDRTIVVSPTPADADTGKLLQVRVALTLIPTDNTTEMPEALRPYYGYILDGLLARLFSMPDKTWTNLRLADPHLRRFQAGKTFTRRDHDVARGYGAVRVRPPRFGV